MVIWNPWQTCTVSEAIPFAGEASPPSTCYQTSGSTVVKTDDFDLPLRQDHAGKYKFTPTEPVYTCLSSCFFTKGAAKWRGEVWDMIRQRQDILFVLFARGIENAAADLPVDWGAGYQNVAILCSCINQEQTDRNLSTLLQLPFEHYEILQIPLLEEIHMERYLASGKIQKVTCGGEMGGQARLCRYDWVLSTREQCRCYHVAFHFQQTGSQFQKGNRVYKLNRSIQLEQAKRAQIDYVPEPMDKIPCIHGMDQLFFRLAQSPFRRRFHLGEQERAYLQNKGPEAIKRHAEDFVRARLAPAHPYHDGKQTPMRGHPVFLAQHATATCCRGCLYKWHGIAQGRPLNEKEQHYVVKVILEWIRRQQNGSEGL